MRRPPRQDSGLKAVALAAALALPAMALPLAAQAGGDGGSSKVGYMLYCSGCHGMDGTGSSAGGIPPFASGVGSFTGDARGRLYMANVPGVVGANVNARQTAAILNYVVETFAGPSRLPQAKTFDEAEISALWSNRPADIAGLRRELVKVYGDAHLPVPPDYPWP